MYPISFILTALLAFGVAIVHAAPAGQPSNVPTCTYTCPPTDSAAFPLGTHSDDGTTLFCSYPAFAGESPNDFFCKYSSATGVVTQDQDVGFCVNKAVSSCPSARRRSALPRAPAPPMAAPVARAPTPDEMKVRSQLKRHPVQGQA